jgi:hypothetical protein
MSKVEPRMHTNVHERKKSRALDSLTEGKQGNEEGLSRNPPPLKLQEDREGAKGTGPEPNFFNADKTDMFPDGKKTYSQQKPELRV